MKKNPSMFYFFLIALIVLFESIAQYHIKKSKVSRNVLFFLVALMSYSIVCLLLGKCYDFNGLGITNFVWSIASIVTMILIGHIFFNEEITQYDIIGMLLSVSGLYLIFIYGHKDD